MGLNLHGVVRGVINVVNPDQYGQWLASTGYTLDAAGKPASTFAAPATVPMQVQALTGSELRHPDFLNVQGVKRAVYLYGNVQGLVRIDAKGGDLLLFPQVLGGDIYTWRVVVVLETWTPTTPGWCKVGVVLQDVAPTAP